MILRYTILFLVVGFHLCAQAPRTAGEIHQGIKKLNVLGSVLYLAAHPDDENTRMIAYLANHVMAETAYLSLTRGDGGQNLIGPEIRELMGVIRTQELLAARKIDGGKQFFSRANDFGFSKNPAETLFIWDKEKVLSDVVWIIRKFQPDIIINRWGQDSAGKTHGHHTASAILSAEAFELAADPDAFPEQLKYVGLWQPVRLFENVIMQNFEGGKSKLIPLDVGVYYPEKGKSNTEIAAESRSQHKCQGMGTARTRGSQNNYLNLIKGKELKNISSIFNGIDISWARLEDSDEIPDLVRGVEKKFQHDAPWKSVSGLLKIHNKINALPESYWKAVKLLEVNYLIRDCLGLYTEFLAEDYRVTRGDTVSLSLEFINRSPIKVILKNISYFPAYADNVLNHSLVSNEVTKFYKKIKIPENQPYTNAFWLNQKPETGIYHVPEQLLRGNSETPVSLLVAYQIQIENTKLDFVDEIVFKKTDPVKGDVKRRLEIVPPVFVNFEEKVYIFSDNHSRRINVRVEAGRNKIKGQLKLNHPKNWRVMPEVIEFRLKEKGESRLFSFEIFPPDDASTGSINPVAILGGQTYHQSLNIINYDHIPIQTVLLPEASKVVKPDIQKRGNLIGYIMGAGDDIPMSLRQIGYAVDLLSNNNITKNNLQKYDAIILGVRAYNTQGYLKFKNRILLEYVKDGGTLIVQYNTGHNLVMPSASLGPYPFQISRDRITDEDATIQFLKPDHQLLNFPNKINPNDFKGWVQERGLYFPNEWDEHYEAILAGNDPGEDLKKGGLLYALYGKGHYIYTGYSWFRELPAGVPGAYRIFSNLISIGKNHKK